MVQCQSVAFFEEEKTAVPASLLLPGMKAGRQDLNDEDVLRALFYYYEYIVRVPACLYMFCVRSHVWRFQVEKSVVVVVFVFVEGREREMGKPAAEGTIGKKRL